MTGRFLIIQPWWRQLGVHDWSGQRHRLLYTVVRGPSGSQFQVIGRTRTWRAAAELRERARLEAQR